MKHDCISEFLLHRPDLSEFAGLQGEWLVGRLIREEIFAGESGDVLFYHKHHR
jgi:hypothetical protein